MNPLPHNNNDDISISSSEGYTTHSSISSYGSSQSSMETESETSLNFCFQKQHYLFEYSVPFHEHDELLLFLKRKICEGRKLRNMHYSIFSSTTTGTIVLLFLDSVRQITSFNTFKYLTVVPHITDYSERQALQKWYELEEMRGTGILTQSELDGVYRKEDIEKIEKLNTVSDLIKTCGWKRTMRTDFLIYKEAKKRDIETMKETINKVNNMSNQK
jgi:hypothetical protein